MATELDNMTLDERTLFSVVHSLDGAPKEKVNTGHGTMRMTVRVCLFALRGYLLLMFGLGFRVLQLAGVVHPLVWL